MTADKIFSTALKHTSCKVVTNAIRDNRLTPSERISRLGEIFPDVLRRVGRPPLRLTRPKIDFVAMSSTLISISSCDASNLDSGMGGADSFRDFD